MRLVAIAAVAENGVIASNGEIPWDYPADKRFYRQRISGHPIIVGRKTYGGTPRPDSLNIVLTTQDLDVPDDVVLANSVEDALETARQTGADTVYVIGGQSVYEAFLPHVDELLITHIPGEYDGDRYFPDWESNGWMPLETAELTDGLVLRRYDPDP